MFHFFLLSVCCFDWVISVTGHLMVLLNYWVCWFFTLAVELSDFDWLFLMVSSFLLQGSAFLLMAFLITSAFLHLPLEPGACQTGRACLLFQGILLGRSGSSTYMYFFFSVTLVFLVQRLYLLWTPAMSLAQAVLATVPLGGGGAVMITASSLLGAGHCPVGG